MAGNEEENLTPQKVDAQTSRDKKVKPPRRSELFVTQAGEGKDCRINNDANLHQLFHHA
jgi:hypothetical protein